MVDWSNIRSQFPVASDSCYLNSAAAGPLAKRTKEAATRFYDQMMRDGDVHWDEWLARREKIRNQVADFINAEPDEIGFTTNTSSGMNVIIDGLEHHGEVISTDLEFPVSTITWMHRRIPVHLAKSLDGELQVEDLRAAMNTRTGIISISHVQFSNGFRSQIENIAEIKGGHALVVNASQSAGVFDIDVKRMKIDALCATGHKWMRAGYGTGFVYLSRELQSRTHARAIGWLSVQDPYAMRNDEVHLRHDVASRCELGCPHFAGIFALGASIEFMQSIGIRQIEERALHLNRTLTQSLTEHGYRVLSPIDSEQSRSAETLVAANDPPALVKKLAALGIVVTEKPSGIRVSTDLFNNEDDIDRLVDALSRI
ncbi:MAG: aminotransferase class V-fold PLP-dependent enzyme [Pyrinomonadaceae bacterium]